MWLGNPPATEKTSRRKDALPPRRFRTGPGSLPVNVQPRTQSNSSGNHRGRADSHIGRVVPPTPTMLVVGVGVAKVSKPVGVGHSIVVQERHHVAGGHFDACVLAAGQPALLPVLDDRHVGQGGAQAAVEVGVVVDNDDDLLCRRRLAPNRRYRRESVIPPIACVGADHHAEGEGAPGRCRGHSASLFVRLAMSALGTRSPRSGLPGAAPPEPQEGCDETHGDDTCAEATRHWLDSIACATRALMTAAPAAPTIRARAALTLGSSRVIAIVGATNTKATTRRLAEVFGGLGGAQPDPNSADRRHCRGGQTAEERRDLPWRLQCPQDGHYDGP